MGLGATLPTQIPACRSEFIFLSLILQRKESKMFSQMPCAMAICGICIYARFIKKKRRELSILCENTWLNTKSARTKMP